jgi:small subunit ribosomal protein S2
MSVVTMKQLLEAGVHFGHQTHKWNPKMKKYIFIKRNGIHIIDLKQTVDAINEAYMFIKDVASRGENVLFVGTKKQAVDAIETVAQKCGALHVNQRWYGGMLTNLPTIRKSIEKMEYFEEIEKDGTIKSFTKLEATRMRRKHDKIEKALGGIRGMEKVPGALFVVDTENEAIAIHEARKLGIPIVGMVDTNCDPDLIDYVIPSNDDAIRAIHLIAEIMGKAVVEGTQSLMEGADMTEPARVEETEEVVAEEAPAEADQQPEAENNQE